MRKIAALLFIAAIIPTLGHAQSGNTTAGLAGIGAGTALGAATNQSGTTPSSVGGGGSTPIEIQIMVFKGLQDMGRNVAESTARHFPQCKSEDQGENGDIDRKCTILVEDSTSANQIAFYQAAEEYYRHLGSLHSTLENYFSVRVTPESLTFPQQVAGQSGQVSVSLTVINTGRATAHINTQNIRVTGIFEEDASKAQRPAPDLVSVDTSDCDREIQPNRACIIKLTFPFPKLALPTGNLMAKIEIPIGQTGQVEEIPLTGKIATAETVESETPAAKSFGYDATAPTGTTPSAPAGPAASPATPVGLTYLSGITTALGGLKAGINYTSSSFQPTTQAFETLVESELRIRGIFPYTSTSALSLKTASDELSDEFGEMLAWSNEINNWATQCKPPAENEKTEDAKKPMLRTNAACTKTEVVNNLAVAQQLMAGYSTLLANPNDGNGSPVITDILRGRVLSDKMADSIPSLQLSVAAAGGSTKTNSFFGVNLFYTFAPSYNGGVIVTFELRNGFNDLWESGARNVLFAYRKWKSRPFYPGNMKNEGECGSFCSVEK